MTLHDFISTILILNVQKYSDTIGLVIIASLDFHKFVILRLFTKSRIREL